VKFYSATKNASSWAMRAWLALRAAGAVFEEEVVDIRRPQRFATLARLGALSPSASAPLLVVDGAAIFDSLAIMEFANDLCGGQLLPAAPLARAQARALLAWQHAGLSGICRRISFESAFYPLKRPLAPHEVAEAERLLRPLDDHLAANGGPFLFGALSLADLALTPTVIRLTRHALDLSGWPRVRAWSEAVLGLPDVVAWLAEAAALPPIWYDDYLLPGAPIDLAPASIA